MAQPLSPWLLVDRAGKNVRLPATMIFLGREDCDITIQVSYKHGHAYLKIVKSSSTFSPEEFFTQNVIYPVTDNRINIVLNLSVIDKPT